MGRGTMRSMVEGLFRVRASQQDQEKRLLDVTVKFGGRNP
jgi:hypothetical protein